MPETFFEKKFEKNLIESFIYHELRREAPYLSQGEVQRISKIIMNDFEEFKKRVVEAKSYETNISLKI